MGHGGLDKELILFAYADRIEVWAKKRYDKVMTQDENEFASLAEDVMGDVDPEIEE